MRNYRLPHLLGGFKYPKYSKHWCLSMAHAPFPFTTTQMDDFPGSSATKPQLRYLD